MLLVALYVSEVELALRVLERLHGNGVIHHWAAYIVQGLSDVSNPNALPGRAPNQIAAQAARSRFRRCAQ